MADCLLIVTDPNRQDYVDLDFKEVIHVREDNTYFSTYSSMIIPPGILLFYIFYMYFTILEPFGLPV